MLANLKISVVVCSRNRAAFLGHTLESLLWQDLPPELFEVIVVDNGSDDKTHEIISIYAPLFRNIQRLYFAKVGLAAARNYGLKHVQSPLVAFLDDDAVADETWLSNLIKGFTDKPSIAAIVGKILPIWGGIPPKWLSPDRYGAYSLTNFDDNFHRLLDREFIIGTNMAFKSEILREVGGFSETIGRRYKDLVFTGELIVEVLIRRKNYEIWHVPGAVVRHYIHLSRLKLRWVLRRSYYQGRSEALMSLELPDVDLCRTSNFDQFLRKVPKSTSVVLVSLFCRTLRVLSYHKHLLVKRIKVNLPGLWSFVR